MAAQVIRIAGLRQYCRSHDAVTFAGHELAALVPHGVFLRGELVLLVEAPVRVWKGGYFRARVVKLADVGLEDAEEGSSHDISLEDVE